MLKKLLSVLLCLALTIAPFSGVLSFASAASTTLPLITIDLEPYETIAPDRTISVSFKAQGSATLAACDTRLEGTSLGTANALSFTPASCGLSNGLYTLVMEATDSLGNTSIEPITFAVSEDAEIAYIVDNGVVTSEGSTAMHMVDALDFAASYGTTADGKLSLDGLSAYNAAELYDLKYTDDAVSVASAAGIPYQVFDVDLQGKTSGNVTISYSGSTKKGERMAVKVYEPATASWKTLGTFTGTGSVSELVRVSDYNDGGKIHVAAVLDYATNGADTMIWSTDPQHYTKFDDLNEYYYKIYQYAADQYAAGDVGYIITTGDLVDDRPTAAVAPQQWGVADKAMSYVEAVGMPNGLVSGNHDVGDYSYTDFAGHELTSDYSMFWKTFPATRYNNKSWYGGSLNNNASHYDLVTVGNVDFIVLYLGYGVEATDETIEWANDVLKTYSHRTAIIATHEYLDARQAVRADTGRGELIYNAIVDPNPNVKMVVCGHDDGSLMLKKTASDGRTFYELLSDYQFVEAEDPDFYANEHYIGSVPHCCGDGYIRLMTVEGDSLTSITYSPVTDRYNPYGDRESFTIDLNCGTADREFLTYNFSAAVLGNYTTLTNVDRVALISSGTCTTYSPVIYATVPAPTPDEDNSVTLGGIGGAYGDAATPSAPYSAVAAVNAPNVANKVDLLSTLGTHPTVTSTNTYDLGLSIDLNKTPYLYYSVAVPEGGHVNFAFINDTTTAPWLVFRDATKGGAALNSTSAIWDSYTENQHFMTTNETGCIDMRTLATSTTWGLNQLKLYNYTDKAAVVSYLFFGSEPIGASAFESTGTAFGRAATPEEPFFAHAAATAPDVDEKVDLMATAGFGAYPVVSKTQAYAMNSLVIDLNKTPYLYYSFAQPADSRFTFAMVNDQSTMPWLTFLDASGDKPIMNYGSSTFDALGTTKFATTSMTGCLDMRELTVHCTDRKLTLSELRLYSANATDVVVSYLFFGSAAKTQPDGDVPNDLAALNAAINKASAVNTALYTADSVAALQKAKTTAAAVATADALAVSEAYARLAEAMGALAKPKATIDESTLTSVKKYNLSLSNWVTYNKTFETTQLSSGGFYLHIPDTETNPWAAVQSTASYTVRPEGGQVFLKFNAYAHSAWSIHVSVTQDGKETVVRMPIGIENGFNSADADGGEGTYSGVYDVSDAFVMKGLDPASTFTVNNVQIYVVGVGGGITVNHFEFFTNKSDGVTNKDALFNAIMEASRRTKSLYTTASWNAMQTALSEANTAFSSSSVTEADGNLKAFKLQQALDALVYADTVTAEAANSLLPTDTARWIASAAGEITATRANGVTTVKNTTGKWPYTWHTLDKPMRVFVKESAIAVDMTVGSAMNLIARFDGEELNLNRYVSGTNLSDVGDLTAGTYRVQIPLSRIPELKGKTTVEIDRVVIYSIGDAASSAVTFRGLSVEEYEESAVTAGDVDANGEVNAADARALLLELLKLTPELTDAQYTAADMNGDGKLNTTDVRLILRKVVNR